ACQLNLNRNEAALKTFNGTFQGRDRDRALFGRAVALQRLGRFEEAETAYESLLASAPNPEEVLSNLIALNMDAGDLGRVRDYCLQLLDSCPRSLTAMQGLASVALDSGDDEAAASWCDRILELAPDCLDAWN